jgi:16S rRNA (cytosine967-C5)-methyltransferase
VTVWRGRLDAALAPLLSRPIGTLDPEILAALRIGAVQLLVLGTPPHAAVSTAASVIDFPAGRGMVNAVVRRLARDGEPRLEPWDRLSHPEDLWNRWSARMGGERATSLMEWDNGIPELGGVVFSGTPAGTRGRHLEEYRVFSRSGPCVTDQGRDGTYIQDEAAAIVGMGFARLPGRVSVEFGASPGGKTAHLDAGSDPLASLDLPRHRFAPWIENRARLGWRNSFPVVADASAPPLRRADRVLIDAPCTCTGVLRRRPDARWRWSPNHLGECVSVQRSLLHSASLLVGTGGWIGYSACSLEPEECLLQVLWFEETHPGFRRRTFPAPAVLVRDGLLDIFPPEHGMDGHFAACWELTP